MASASKPFTRTAAANTKEEITMEIPTYIRVYKDGTIERLQNSPIVPARLEDPTTTSVSSKDVVISDNPPISARLYLPKSIQSHEKNPNQNHKVPILVYFHGGGFFFESAFRQAHHNHLNLLVSEAEVLVISVEYRLAPEVPLPAAYDDCWEALKWVVTTTNTTEPWLIKHGDFGRVFIGGDSAGANIVHNIAMRAGAEVLPCGVKLFGAFVSHPYFFGSKPIGAEPVEGHEESVPFLTWGLVYPSAPSGLDNPFINPLALGAPCLSGLGCSKLLVCIAGRDLLRDRGFFYYEAVKKSGWQGELELFEVEGEDHVFHIDNPESGNAKKMLKRFAHFLLQ